MSGPLSKFVAIGAGCFLLACLVSAQAVPSPTPTASTPPTPAPTATAAAIELPSAKAEVDRLRAMDATFLKRAQRRALEDLELSRIVAERSANSAVRAFAQEMVDVRGRASQALRQHAEREGIDLPATPDAAVTADIERVSRLSTPELDRAYVERMLRDLDADVADFQAQAGAAQEVELYAWVCDTLPQLEEQQERIHALASDLGIPARRAP